MRLTVLALAFALLLPQANADQRVQTREQIAATQKAISDMQRALAATQQQHSAETRKLKALEGEIGTLSQQIRELSGELTEGEQELKRLAVEKRTHEQAKQRQQALLASQARAAYQSGRQEYLKLLLNQEHPEKLSRTLTYYDYLNQARLEQLSVFNETLRQLANIEAQIEGTQARLLVRKGTLELSRAELKETLNARQKLLASLNQQSQSQQAKLRASEQKKAELDQVLKSIEQTLARQAAEAQARAERQRAEAARAQQAQQHAGPTVATGSAQRGSFVQAKGKLPWPANGQIVARYGSPRGDDPRSTWDGVMIAAAEGSPVKAVHAGRVVFADWLRGAGQLIIVEHGNGYLSLYGHNQSLLKKAGDSVNAGDTLATVGTSGGQSSAALYFAIRQQGRASDPMQWCRTP